VNLLLAVPFLSNRYLPHWSAAKLEGEESATATLTNQNTGMPGKTDNRIKKIKGKLF